MKPLKLTFTLLLLAGFAFLSSCSKDDESNLSRLELLTQKPWKLTATALLGFDAGPPESTSADDIYTFKADGSYEFDEGPTKEDASDPQTLTGTWEFRENESIIRVSYGGITLDQEILELSTTTLKVKFNFIFDIENTYGH